MSLFHRNPQAQIKPQPELSLLELDAALKSLASVQPPAGLTERMSLAVERAAETLPAKQAGRFGLLSFAGRTPMYAAASAALVIAMITGVATYQWQGAHRGANPGVNIVAPLRIGSGFGSAGAAHTPGPAQPPTTAKHTDPPLVVRGNQQPHHTVSSRAHLPRRPMQVPLGTQP